MMDDEFELELELTYQAENLQGSLAAVHRCHWSSNPTKDFVIFQTNAICNARAARLLYVLLDMRRIYEEEEIQCHIEIYNEL